MRLGSSAAICAWAAVIYLAASSFWRVRSSLSVRKAVQKDVYILQGDSTVGGAIETASRLGKLLKDEGAPATYYNMTVAVLDTAKPQYLTNLSFVGSPNTTHTHHVDSSPRVWLYALFNVNYDGAELAVHFARHYISMGMHASMIYVDLLYDPALADDGLRKTEQHFQHIGSYTRRIPQPYSPTLQDVAMVAGLAQIPMNPEDWVIVADMDEFYTFGNSSSVQVAAQVMEQEGASFALGEVLDHVALGGTLNHVAAAPDIWSQFPLICPIIAKIAKGHAAKVTMHRAYLRSGPGHHYIVHPHLAEMYFGGKCTGLACELVVKRFKQRSTHDLYNYTPYKQYADRYAETVTAPGWRAQRWQTWTKVHHFKWFSAVLDNLQARMVRESGDCLLSINEHSCRPVSQFWHEIARQYHKINSTQRINIKELQCQEGIDTLWNWSVR